MSAPHTEIPSLPALSGGAVILNSLLQSYGAALTAVPLGEGP